MKATVENIIAPAENIRVINLNCAQKLDYKAGQYLRMAVGDMDGQFYSIASAPHRNVVELHIKKGAGQSSQYIAEQLKAGDTVTIEGVSGDMTFGSDAAKPVIMIAGGLGIAPMKAMVEQIVHEKRHETDIHLYWGAAVPEELYLRMQFEQLSMIYRRLHVHCHAGGNIIDQVLEAEHDLAACDIYLAGRKEMLDVSISQLEKNGADPSCIFYDKAVMKRGA